MKNIIIFSNVHNHLFKFLLLVPLLTILICIISLNNGKRSVAYSIPSEILHNSFTTSYRISQDKRYSDNILSDSSNFYYIDLYNMSCNSKTSISLIFSGKNLSSLDYQFFKDNFTSMSYNVISSHKNTITISFPYKSDSERIYIAINNTSQSKKIKYKIKLNLLTPHTSRQKSKINSKTKKKTHKKITNTHKTKTKKYSKKTKSNKTQKNKNKPKNNKKLSKVNTSKFRVKKIKLSKNFIRLPVKSKYYISYKILPSNAKNKNVKWYSSNKNVVSVKSGHIYTHKKGIAIIHISSLSNKKVTASCTIKVI